MKKGTLNALKLFYSVVFTPPASGPQVSPTRRIVWIVSTCQGLASQGWGICIAMNFNEYLQPMCADLDFTFGING